MTSGSMSEKHQRQTVMLPLLIVIWVLPRPLITVESLITESTVIDQTTDTAEFISADSFNERTTYPITVGYFTSELPEDCFCSYYLRDRNLKVVVNGRRVLYKIWLKKGKTALLSCRNSSMNLIWSNGVSTSNYVSLTCIECRRWKDDDFPSCQAIDTVESRVTELLPTDQAISTTEFISTHSSMEAMTDPTRVEDSTSELPEDWRYPTTVGDLASELPEDCVCSYYHRDRNLHAVVNGRRVLYAIRLRKGNTALLSCRNPSMNLVWPNGAFMSKHVNLTCIECRRWKDYDFPSCQASDTVEGPITELFATDQAISTTEFTSTDSSTEATTDPTTVGDFTSEIPEDCVCSYYHPDSNLHAVVNGRRVLYTIWLRRGETALLSCRNPSMNLIWLNGAFTSKYVNLTCIECRRWKDDDVPSCQASDGVESLIPESTVTDQATSTFISKESSNEATTDPTTIGDLVSELPENCACSYYHRYMNLYVVVNGRIAVYLHTIWLRKGETALLSCKNSSMNLIWSHGTFTSKYVNLTCIECRRWKEDDIPSCQDSDTESQIRCPPIHESDAFVVIYSNNRNINSTASFYCKDVKQLVEGSHTTTCLSTGEWSDASPTCKETQIRCPTIDESGAFVIVYSNDRFINSTASFYCKDVKLIMEGLHTRTCLTTGEWSEANPTCKDPDIRCTRFSNNMDLLIIDYDDNDFRAGSRASFSCRKNSQKLNGTRVAVCLRTGVWSSPPPQCIESQIHCPPIDGGGIFVVVYGNDRNINSTARFYCKDVNKLIEGLHTRTCLTTGEWSDASPTCKDPNIRCKRFSNDDMDLLIVDYDDNDFRAGSRASFSCRKNSQKLNGTRVAVCLRSGEWSSPPPQCTDSSKDTALDQPADEDPGSKLPEDCVCTYFHSDRNLHAVVNGNIDAYGIRLRKGQTALLRCGMSSMNLVWPNGDYVAKSVNLTCNVCRQWTSNYIPSCQASQIGTYQKSIPCRYGKVRLQRV